MLASHVTQAHSHCSPLGHEVAKGGLNGHVVTAWHVVEQFLPGIHMPHVRRHKAGKSEHLEYPSSRRHSYSFHFDAGSLVEKLPPHHQEHSSGVSKDFGIVDLAQPGSDHVCKLTLVVHNALQHHRKEALVVCIN